MIEVTSLSKSFGTNKALDAMDLRVGAGEVYALLGANGAGKTTTISLLLGFLRADAGQVGVAGIDPAADPEQARAVTAYIPEQVSLYPSSSGLENLAYLSSPGCFSTRVANNSGFSLRHFCSA